jgi:hypothetical protein
VQIEKDDRELLVEEPPQGLLAGARHDKFVAEFLQRLHSSEGVPFVVVDDQDASLERRRQIGRKLALSQI